MKETDDRSRIALAASMAPSDCKLGAAESNEGLSQSCHGLDQISLASYLHCIYPWKEKTRQGNATQAKPSQAKEAE